MSYKIANLLHFYMLTMQRTLGEKAALSRVLQEREAVQEGGDDGLTRRDFLAVT